MRVVLDTNVVVSALVLSSPHARALRAEWLSGRLVPLVSGSTTAELIRVLAYPKFKLRPEEQRELLGELLERTEAVQIPPRVRGVPRCRDPFDIPFLELAVVGRAALLVTGDRALLELNGKIPAEILSLSEFLGRLG